MAEGKLAEIIVQLQTVLYQAKTMSFYLAKESDEAGLKPGKDVMERIGTAAALLESTIGTAVKLAEQAY